MKLYAIPDIHGRADLLDALMDKLRTEEALDLARDKIVFLGDMIDRGPDSAGVLRRVRNLVEAHPENVIALAGNHEWIAIEACLTQCSSDLQLWMWNGGGPTTKSFGTHKTLPDEWVKWMAALPLLHREEGFFFSHAPAPAEEFRRANRKGETEFNREELTWTYHPDEERIARVHDDGVIGVCGHIHEGHVSNFNPRMYEHYIFADAGCGCYDEAPLVAVEVRERRTIYAHPADIGQTSPS